MISKKIDWIIFISIFVLAFSIRLIYALTLEMPIPIRGDGVHYVQYASNLIDHFTFSKDRSNDPIPDSYWAPGYPFFLAFCMLIAKVIGIHFYPVTLLMQAALGALVAALTYKLGRLVLAYKGALLAAIFTILSPHLISHGAYVLSETLLSLLLIVSIYFYIQANMYQKHHYYWLSGIFFGFCYLVNPVVLVVPFFLTFYFYFFYKNKKLPIFLIAFVTIAALWSIRELCVVNNEKASTSDRAFENLVIGSHSNYHDIWRANPRDKNNPYEIDMAEYKNNHSIFYKELLERIIDNPTHYFKWYLIQKPLDLWGWDILVGQGDIYVYTVSASLYSKSNLALLTWALMKNTHYILLVLCILGIFFLFKEENSTTKKNVTSLYVLLTSISMVYILLHSDARYSVPMRPELYVCAVYVIKVFFKLKKEKADMDNFNKN